MQAENLQHRADLEEGQLPKLRLFLVVQSKLWNSF